MASISLLSSHHTRFGQLSSRSTSSRQPAAPPGTSAIIPANNFNVWIGADSQLYRHVWNGLIDDVRIYSYALSAEQIRGLYENKDSPGDKQ